MPRDVEQIAKDEEEFYKHELDQYSEEELARIKAQDEARKRDGKLVDEMVKKTVEENPGQVWDEEAIEKHEEEKRKKLKEIYSD